MFGTARTGVLLLAIASLGSLAGCFGWGSYDVVEEVREQSAIFGAEEAIEVETRNGSVVIERGDVAEAEVVAALKARDEDRLSRTLVVVERAEDGTLRVGAEPADGRWMDGEGASFTITVPGASGVSVATSNGSITLRGLGGPAELRTSNGRIEVDDHDGDALADSSNGAVVLAGVAGDASAETSNGRIEAAGVAGRTDLRTSNGAIVLDVHDGFSGAIIASTSNGRVTVGGADGERARITRSSRGRTELSIGDADATSTLSTSNGAITIRIGGERG